MENRKKPFNPRHFDYRFKRMQIWKNRSVGSKRKKMIEEHLGLSESGSRPAPSRVQKPAEFSRRGFERKPKQKILRARAGLRRPKSSEAARGGAQWEPSSKISLEQIEQIFRDKESLLERQSDRFSNRFHKNYLAIDLGKMRGRRASDSSSFMGGAAD